jgi:predicted ATPase/class 3 adenylate cyclase
MAEPAGDTVTLLFSDIEGSTRLLQRTGDAYAGILSEHRRLLGEVFERHGAVHADAEGDSFFVVFPSASEAAAAAEDGQRALAGHPWPEGNEVRVRIGIHSGEPRLVDGGYVGLDVHHAARVMAAGHGGQVLVSEATRTLLDERFELRDLGEHLLKDIAASERLYQLVVEGLPADFPALSTLGNRPTNLPAVPNPFIGRLRELEELSALLTRNDVRLVTLTGPGGTGKSRLAFQVATAVLEDFANGAFFVPLAPLRDWELVVPTVAQTVGLRERAGESSVAALTEYLHDRQMLLVLDNLEQVVAVGPALAELLASAPGLKVIATSRTPLNLSVERTYAVTPLALDESVPLFAERARAAGADFTVTEENEAIVAEICARLEGLPLAIELAAPRVRTLTPAALLRRLDRRLALLTGGPQDLDERQRTLRGTIEWSYDLLSPDEQTLFTRLGIFVGGSRLDAAEAVSDTDDTLDLLESLVEKSLLRQRADSDGEPRFWMLETIREFARERLDSSGEAGALGQRHAGWFAELAESLDAQSRTGDQPAAIARLVDDYPNLRAAMGTARAGRDGELLLRLATALWPFWATRGYVGEGQRALEDAFELSGRRPARALLGLSSLHVLSVSSAGLLDEVHEALRAAEELGDPLTLAQAWNLLGQVEGTLLGSLAQAEEAWRQALAYAERANLRAERADSIGWLMMSANFGPLPVEEGIARCRTFHDEAADDPFIQANSRIELAALEAMRGDFVTARALLARGRQALAELGFTLMVAMSAQEAHYVEILAGDPAAAARISRESYAQLEPLGERAYLSTAAALLAHALGDLDELDEAEHFSRVSEDASSPEDVFSQVLWRSGRAKICARRGDLGKAETLAREAVVLSEKTDLLNTQGDTLADLAEVLALAGKPQEAACVLDQAAERFERKGNLVSLERMRTLAPNLGSASPA